ncbi:MAG: hypothetical protein KBI47_19435 [Armatimonadetes bacterium]|nr:hypothetical protein [Armatimonadota bacterium]
MTNNLPVERLPVPRKRPGADMPASCLDCIKRVEDCFDGDIPAPFMDARS